MPYSQRGSRHRLSANGGSSSATKSPSHPLTVPLAAARGEDPNHCDPKKQDYYTVGCVKDSLPEQVLYGMVSTMIVLSVILAFLSAIVVCCGPSNPVEQLN